MAAVQLRERRIMTDRRDALEELDEPEKLVLSDLINRVLDKGVMIKSHLTISVADIDLIELDLNLLISSVSAMRGKHI
jgi:hypothetical protein